MGDVLVQVGGGLDQQLPGLGHAAHQLVGYRLLARIGAQALVVPVDRLLPEQIHHAPVPFLGADRNL